MKNTTAMDDQAMIAEALRRMNAHNSAIPAQKVREFLKKLNEEWDRTGEMSQEQIREMFKRFVAEASHVPN